MEFSRVASSRNSHRYCAGDSGSAILATESQGSTPESSPGSAWLHPGPSGSKAHFGSRGPDSWAAFEDSKD